MSEIFHTNPYESHESLSPLEAEVLWEYAKLSQHVTDVRSPIMLLAVHLSRERTADETDA
jgi:hypothetical protein